VAIPFSSVLATPPFGGGPGFLATSTSKFFYWSPFRKNFNPQFIFSFYVSEKLKKWQRKDVPSKVS